MRTALALLLMLCASGPLAAEMTRVEDLMGCQTSAAAKHFVEMGADQAAMDAANKEYGTEVCSAMRVSFLVVGILEEAHHNNDKYYIIEVAIYGVGSNLGMQRLKQPARWYAIANVTQKG